MKLKVGDQVIVTIGKDKGRKGKVEEVFPKLDRVLVGGVNIYKRHRKRRDDKHPGGVIEIGKPLSVGKVAFFCPKCSTVSRIGYSLTGKDKVRICKKCGQKI